MTFALTLILVIFYGSFFTHRITLVTSDLGRHLENGKLFFQDWRIIGTNFYSYTEPEFPVVNHHWGSGALLYAIWKLSGFFGVQFFVIALNIAAFLISFFLARKHVGAGLAAFLAVLIIPILGTRTELRPESMSYLFMMLFFLTLVRFRDNPSRLYRGLFLLPLLELLWVNSHIYFFLGPLFVLAFLFEAMIVGGLRGNVKKLAIIYLATSAATLINPFGIRGALAPFTILRQYGYRLVENQSVWFLEKLMTDASFGIYKFALVLLCASFIIRMIWQLHNKRSEIGEPFIALLCLGIGVSVMACLQIRNFALFGFMALPILAENIGAIFRVSLEKYKQHSAIAAFVFLLLVFLITISGALSSIFPYWQEFGLGLESGDAASIEFFQREHLHGPLFNNYDIGGYLIFYLFPRERVFVDNRPEAYSVDFFEKMYIPMQESAEKWQENLERFGFNVIFFSYHDMTPWAQKFLVDRVNDLAWVPVFADKRVIIFLRNIPENKSVIDQFAIPKERFSARSN